MLVAKSVLSEGYVPLDHAFSIVSPNVKYTAEKARRMLLHMPLATLTVGVPTSGKSFTILLELLHSVDYSKYNLVVNGMASSLKEHNPQRMEKSCVKLLLGLAQSDRERECMKYAIVKASGMTATQARRMYGFERMTERARQVEKAIDEVQRICETIDDIARIKDKALLASFGIEPQSDSSDDDEPFDGDDVGSSTCELSATMIGLCKQALTESNYNWFELIERLESEIEGDHIEVSEKLYLQISTLGFTDRQLNLINQSKEAFSAARNDAYELERTARIVNGCIVSESESDNPEQYTNIKDPFTEQGRILISKRRQSIRRRARRLRAKAIAEQRFLSKKNRINAAKFSPSARILEK